MMIVGLKIVKLKINKISSRKHNFFVIYQFK